MSTEPFRLISGFPDIMQTLELVDVSILQLTARVKAPSKSLTASELGRIALILIVLEKIVWPLVEFTTVSVIVPTTVLAVVSIVSMPETDAVIPSNETDLENVIVWVDACTGPIAVMTKSVIARIDGFSIVVLPLARAVGKQI